jgi:hypothetical protein
MRRSEVDIGFISHRSSRNMSISLAPQLADMLQIALHTARPGPLRMCDRLNIIPDEALRFLCFNISGGMRAAMLLWHCVTAWLGIPRRETGAMQGGWAQGVGRCGVAACGHVVEAWRVCKVDHGGLVSAA